MNPLPPDPTPDDLLYMSPADRCLKQYISSEPDVQMTVNNLARSCIQQVITMGLKMRDQETRDVICASLNFHEIFSYTPSPTFSAAYGEKEIQRFRYLTGLDKYGEQISPEEKEKMRELLKSVTEGGINSIPGDLERVFATQAQQVIKEARTASKGWDEEARVKMMKHCVANAMEPSAIILREAASLATLDPECMESIRHAVTEEGLTPLEFSQTAHTLLIGEMSQHLTFVIDDEISAIAKKQLSFQRARDVLIWALSDDEPGLK